MRPYIFLLSLATLFGGAISAQSVPRAIFTDPPPDPANPARLTVLRIPTHSVQINGTVYQPSGAGPHPTLVICPGLPGYEKNSILRRQSAVLAGTLSPSAIAAHGEVREVSVFCRTLRAPTLF